MIIITKGGGFSDSFDFDFVFRIKKHLDDLGAKNCFANLVFSI